MRQVLINNATLEQAPTTPASQGALKKTIKATATKNGSRFHKQSINYARVSSIFVTHRCRTSRL